jgi:hypothetical protein
MENYILIMEDRERDLSDGGASSIVVVGDLLDLDGGGGGAFLHLVDGLLLLLLLVGDGLGRGGVLFLLLVVIAGGEILLPGVGLRPWLEAAFALDGGAPLDLPGGGGGRSAFGLPLPLAVEAVVVGGLDLGLPLEVPLPPSVDGGPLDLASGGLGDVGVLPGGGLGADGELERGDAVGEVPEEEGRGVEWRRGGGKEEVEVPCGERGCAVEIEEEWARGGELGGWWREEGVVEEEIAVGAHGDGDGEGGGDGDGRRWWTAASICSYFVCALVVVLGADKCVCAARE